MLLRAGANACHKNYAEGTALFVAKSPAAVRLLAAAGASVNDINYASLTPLHTAKDVGVVQALIELGTRAFLLGALHEHA